MYYIASKRAPCSESLSQIVIKISMLEIFAKKNKI